MEAIQHKTTQIFHKVYFPDDTDEVNVIAEFQGFHNFLCRGPLKQNKVRHIQQNIF